MTSLGFENYAEALKIYLTKYREVSTPFFFFRGDFSPRLSVAGLVFGYRGVSNDLPRLIDIRRNPHEGTINNGPGVATGRQQQDHPAPAVAASTRAPTCRVQRQLITSRPGSTVS
jgi:hypothetical protein